MPFADVNGARIYYEIDGDGPWLAFAHGAAGNHLSWWQQVPELAARFRCLTFDHRGWGRSECSGAAMPADFAGDLEALLDHVGAAEVSLVGQSMGGWTVAGCALRNPARVRRLVLAATLAGLADDAMLARLAAVHSGSAAFDGHMALAADYPRREPAMTFLYDRIAGLNPAPNAEFLRALVSLRYEDAAERLRMPVLFVAGAGDRLFPLDLLRAAHAKLPASSLVVVPAAGHSAYFECAAEFNRSLAAFLHRA